jgi:hypothetical protein
MWGVFFGIIHKAELEWQLIIVLYSRHMQGELKSSLNFMSFLAYCNFSKTIVAHQIEGTLGKN